MIKEFPAVFLDRDGVINRAIVREGSPYPPANLSEFEIMPSSISTLTRLANSGYMLIGVTNQPDVARGTQSADTVKLFNELIQSRLPIQEIFVCYHDSKDHCNCRKPKPGLILQAQAKYRIDMSKSWMVGDRWKDIAAGHSVGLRTIFIDYHYNEDYLGQSPDFTIQGTSQLANIILEGVYS